MFEIALDHVRFALSDYGMSCLKVPCPYAYVSIDVVGMYLSPVSLQAVPIVYNR